ncbi:MAG: hypothetical protein EOM50_06170 [Erysipelotrichia bacterium]|nr:hypothetical protein [Erysipelotrichia bacterium]NCC54865.1 hypothetical protein [Erysipelotrichia bacterium]
MNYVKNNKTFIFLFAVLLVVISILFYRLLLPTNNNASQPTNVDTSTSTAIRTFSGYFNEDNLSVDLSWNISSGNKKISKIELYYNDVILEDVSNSFSVSLSESDYDLTTGNNKFDLVVKFDDDSELKKTKYVYIDEAHTIKMVQQNNENKTIYTLTYYYDKRNKVDVPSMQINGISGNFEMNYINSEVVSEDRNFIKMKVVYELVYKDLKPGNYQATITFAFPQYNLSKEYTTSFQVNTQQVNESTQENGNQNNSTNINGETSGETGESENETD